MVSLGSHEEKLVALATLLEQLFVQQFRNVVPHKIADETLADWEQTALGVLKDRTDASGYVKEFYGEIREALEHIRSKAR